MTVVEIEGTYECGHTYKRLVTVNDPPTGDRFWSWWQDVVWPEIGDHHEEDEGNCTVATIIDCRVMPSLVGDDYEWVTG